MKNLLILSFSLLVLPLSAQDEKKVAAPAERLLKVTGFQSTILEGGEIGFTMVEQSLVNQNLNKKEMAEVKDAFMAYMMELATDPVLTKKTVELYEQNFTEAEIEELIEFYETPVGKKTLKVLPKITGESMKMSTELAQKHVGSFQKALTGVLERKAAREEGKDK